MSPLTIEVTKLEYWLDFLEAQVEHFNAAIMREDGHLRVADEINTAFLKTDDAIVGPEIEKAVRAFIRDGAWPQKLGARKYRHLSFRANGARPALLTVILSKLDDDDPRVALIRPQLPGVDNPKLVGPVIRAGMPDLDDKERMIPWLFIDTWKARGQAHLDALTNTFLKVVLPSRASGQHSNTDSTTS
jgi:hypothetical protein